MFFTYTLRPTKIDILNFWNKIIFVIPEISFLFPAFETAAVGRYFPSPVLLIFKVRLSFSAFRAVVVSALGKKSELPVSFWKSGAFFLQNPRTFGQKTQN